MPNNILEARIQQADEHQRDTSANLDILVEQGGENNPNPNLEAMIEQNDNNTEKVVKKIDEMKPKQNANVKNMSNFIAGFFEQMVGADGYTPINGKDYFTKEDKKKFLNFVIKESKDYIDKIKPVKGKDYRDGKDGKAPVKGVDYFDGKQGKPGVPGKDAKVNIEEIVDMVINRIPRPKNGKDADVNVVLKMVLDKLNNLEGDDRISYNNLKDVPQMYKQEGAMGGMSNTTVLQNLDGNPENLSAQCDGSNTVFDVTNKILSVIFLSLNGQVLLEGLDFTKTTNQITLLRNTPESGEELYIKYVQN